MVAAFAGQLGQEAQGALLDSGQPLNSLVLKVPHHGGESSLTLPVREAVNPEVAVISVGADNRFGHPDEVTLRKLEEIPSYRADQQGHVEMLSDGERYCLLTGQGSVPSGGRSAN